jgi:hypothetical protein
MAFYTSNWCVKAVNLLGCATGKLDFFYFKGHWLWPPQVQVGCMLLRHGGSSMNRASIVKDRTDQHIIFVDEF